MSDKPQFTLYSTVVGPNGWKVAMVLAELDLTYETKYLDFSKKEQKSAEYLKLNPNGRIPAIVDHSNSDFTLWESNAIIEYLVAKYDTTHKLSFSDFNNQQYMRQWLYFQASGQGPYYGQAVWFIKECNSEPREVVERYQNETRRVIKVLESVLSEQEWLVGGKLSAADIAFLQWNTSADRIILGPEFIDIEAPHVRKWMNKLIARPAIAAVMQERAKKLSG
ncbi:Glutathione S-transferase [Pleurostoma richardsiae]|uniref:glutathione transferase n=1 Tax=Pleurostoma richardsiae TaxID=41990 RepID=A0AA38VXY4_9PEZI|nr:Glutathione S-transferase [Pleurostoma richardsiae]